MPFVYCTGSANTEFAIYIPSGNKDLGLIERTILIKGGANVADKHFVTPKGVMTEVSDEDLALLEKDYSFNEMRKNGFITVEHKEVSVEKAVSNMKPKDLAAPRTPEDSEFNQETGTKVAPDSKRVGNKKPK